LQLPLLLHVDVAGPAAWPGVAFFQSAELRYEGRRGGRRLFRRAGISLLVVVEMGARGSQCAGGLDSKLSADPLYGPDPNA
jgi:hypothetical protein